MGNWWRDLRYGWRMLAKNKAFAAIAILALAFGIGPNVAIFSIVWATFLAPLPYPHPEQLVVVWTKVKGERNPTRADDFLQYAAQSKSFQRLDFGPWDTPVYLTGTDHEQEDIAGQVSWPGEYTETLGIHMALGRDLLPADGVTGNDHVVVITHQLWQERFHGDPNILQKQIRINDQPYAVVGVYQAGIADRIPARFLVPTVLQPGEQNRHWGGIMGRLKPGVSIAQAQAELAVIDRRLAQTRPGDLPKEAWTVSVEQLKNDYLDKKLERNLWLLLASVGFVLLIACANLANLLLARGAARQQELAVRSAMGATRTQVFTQLLAESLSLSVVGGVVGISLGWGLMKLSMAMLPLEKMTAEAVVGMNTPVLCFAVGVTMVAGILAGCAPALQAAKLNLSEILKQNSRSVSGRGRFRTQQLLVMGEFALALTLLAGAGMALHSFWNLTHVDMGVRTDHVLTGFLQPPKGPPLTNMDQISANARQLLARVEALPEVQKATLTTNIPLHGHDEFPFSIAGKPVAEKDKPQADLEIVTPSYFDTFGAQLVRGRLLNDGDQANSTQVVVVSQSFVDKYLQGMDPLDQRLLLSPIVPGQQKLGTPTARQIVGVFHGVRNGEKLNDTTVPQIFVPYWQSPWPYAALAVRTSLDPGLVTKSLRTTVAQALPGYSLTDIETMQHVIDTQLVNDRFGMVLFGGFALLALVLAALGIYGVMAFAVAQRSHEIGLRMALGAQRRDAVLLILRDGMKLALFGVGLGLVGVIGLGYLMRSTLYGVKFIDPASFALVAGALLAVAMIASYVPARRSAKVDPMIALRQE
jgi:putative ABC transport system permease protein